MRIVAIVRRGGEQQQPVAAPGDHLRQPPAQCVVTIRACRLADAVMRFVDDREVPRRSLEILQHPFLLDEIERGQAERDRIERIAAQLVLPPLLLQHRSTGDRHEPQAEALSQLLFPLHQQGPGRRYDQHAVRASPCDQLAHNKARLNRFAQSDVVRQEKPRPRQLQRAHQGHELVRFDPQPPRLRGQQLGGTGHLLEQARLMIQPPCRQRSGFLRSELGAVDFDLLDGLEKIPFEAAQVTRGTAQAKQPLRAKLRDLDDVPGQPARADPGSHREIHAHSTRCPRALAPGPRFAGRGLSPRSVKKKQRALRSARLSREAARRT